jgi:hypothetical protein
MITWGFAFNYSDLVTIGINFIYPSAYIYVSGNTGDIVYLNSAGLPQYFPNAQGNNIYPIGATQIVTSATINGVLRTTTATGLVYCSTTIP